MRWGVSKIKFTYTQCK